MPSSAFDSVFDVPFGGPPIDVNAPVESVMGKDIFFNGNTLVSAKGDYQTVAGEENYRRAIMRRLITVPGTHRLRPTYGAGVPTSIKQKMTRSTLDSLKQRIKEQVQSDRRTEAVLDVTLTETTFDNKPGLRVLVRAKAFGRELRPLVYNFSKEA